MLLARARERKEGVINDDDDDDDDVRLFSTNAKYSAKGQHI